MALFGSGADDKTGKNKEINKLTFHPDGAVLKYGNLAANAPSGMNQQQLLKTYRASANRQLKARLTMIPNLIKNEHTECIVDLFQQQATVGRSFYRVSLAKGSVSDEGGARRVR